MDMKITEPEMLLRFQPGSILLPPLVIRSCQMEGAGRDRGVDARIELALPGEEGGFRFAVESKADSTPRSVQLAVARAKAAAGPDEHPMIQVPYLSPERLEELERQGVSGVDLCGNGVVIVPGHVWVVRSGQPNRYRDSRPLNNPYAGRSAMVARMLLLQRRWDSLSSLAEAIRKRGAALSLSQASKAVRAMQEDLIVTKDAGAIVLQEPPRLLDRLGKEWRKPTIRLRQAFRLQPGTDWPNALSSDQRVRWAVTGESSASRYVTFRQGGALRVAVSHLSMATGSLPGTPESVPNFADIELFETDEPGFFFAAETDDKGIRWASRLQTWLELQAGDARQQEAARDLRTRILKEAEQ